MRQLEHSLLIAYNMRMIYKGTDQMCHSVIQVLANV